MSQFSGSTFGSYSRWVLFLVGGILALVGIGMAVGLGGVPFAGATMIFTGGIMAVVGIGMIIAGFVVGRRAAATGQLLQTGIAGTAQIIGLTQTGMYLNENPQVSMNLLVSLPGQTPYAATHREIVPLILLGRLTSGAPLAVRVDPADFNRIAVDWGSSGFGAGMPAMAGISGMPGMAGMAGAPMAPMAPSSLAAPMAGSAQTGSQMDESLSQVQAALAGTGMQAAQPFSTAAQGDYTVEQLRAYLRQNGLQASAHVDKMEDSGKVVGDERLYTMEMTLNVPGKSPQKLPSSAAMVPVAVSHKLFQGMNVPVRYAAENPNLLMVEWDKI